MNAIQQFGLVVVGQATAVSLVAVLLMLFSRRNAARRHSIGLLGLVLVLSSPLMTLVLPQTAWWRWSSSAASVAESPRGDSAGAASEEWQPVLTPVDVRVTDADVLVDSEPTPIVADVTMSPASIVAIESPTSAADSMSIRRISWPSLLGVVWFLGAIVSASYWAWQCWRLRSLVRSLSLGVEADSQVLESLAGDVCTALRLGGLPSIAVSEVIPMPMVLGLWRPVVVLPRELLQVGASARLREVLIHECAHVARRDPWVNVAQRLAAVLWWWHPGVLWLNRLIARSREEVCDNFVLRHGDATSYAQTLLELTERCSSRGRFVPALGLLGSRWTLEERITGLLKPGRDTMTQTKRRTVVLMAALLGALCLLVGGVRAVDERQAKPEATKPAAVADAKPAPKETDEKVVTRKVVIRGTCQSEDGKPVANARVRVFRKTDNDEPLPFLVESTVDQDGKFELREIETTTPAKPDLLVIVTAEKHVPFVDGPMKHDNGVIELSAVMSSKPGTLSGVVTDSRGQPIKGVTVFLPAGGNHPYPGIWSAVTDEKGRYAITDMKRWTPESTKTFDPKTQTGEMVSASYFALKHPDFPLTRAKNTAVPQEVDVTLYPPAMVEGQVVDAVTNRPAANVVVSAQGVARHGWSQTKTDADGRYRLLLTKDHYNIWAEADDRIAIAVSMLEAAEGKTVSNADIKLVRGGFVVGRVLDNEGKPMTHVIPKDQPFAESDQPRAKPEPMPVHVAHYGPARPRTGAAVTSTKVNPDGTYRLRVAPGQNYVYLMSNLGKSATITVEDGKEVTLDFHHGEKRTSQFVERTAEEKLADRLRREAAEEEAVEASGGRAKPKLPVRKRAATPTGKLLDQLEEQNAGTELFNDPWLRTLKQIVDLGPAAVPELVQELDSTTNDRMLRCLAFTLRAIDDKRAVPALIRSIPKILLPTGSDCGLTATDPELVKFAQQHDRDPSHQGNEYSFGRPVNEIFGALHKLTGQKFDESELVFLSDRGFPSQRQARERLVYNTAKKWADWWENHGAAAVPDQAYSRVNVPPAPENNETWSLTPGMRFKMNGGGGNCLLESVLDPKAETVFHDFDTGRYAALPARWRDQPNIAAHLPDILSWAAREGFDLMGTEHVSATDNKRTFALQPIGLRAWQLGQQRWKPKSKSGDFSLEEAQADGIPADGLLFYFDRQKESFDPASTAAFLFITREGTPGLIFVGIEVTNTSDYKTGVVSKGDNELNPIHFRKGRRFGWTAFEEVGGKAAKR